MIFSRATATSLLVLTITTSAPGQDWKRRSFPEWNDNAVLRLLTDSPWTRPKSVDLQWHKPTERPFRPEDIPGTGPNANKTFGSPVGGIGVPKADLPLRANLLIRWASALPVRQAEAIYRQRDEKLPASKLNEMVGVPYQDYVVEIFGAPAEMAHQGTATIELLAQQAVSLKTKSGRTLKPTRAEAKLNGLTMTILVHFSKTDPITLKDEEVECTGDLQVFKFREQFKLSAMTYLGHLEL